MLYRPRQRLRCPQRQHRPPLLAVPPPASLAGDSFAAFLHLTPQLPVLERLCTDASSKVLCGSTAYCCSVSAFHKCRASKCHSRHLALTT